MQNQQVQPGAARARLQKSPASFQHPAIRKAELTEEKQKENRQHSQGLQSVGLCWALSQRKQQIQHHGLAK